MTARLTYSLAEAAEMIPCTEGWLAEGLRAGRFRGHKIMGRWRLTDVDMAAIIDSCAVQPTRIWNDAPIPESPLQTEAPSFVDNLAPRSRAALARKRAVAARREGAG